jgi:hypothetical protein
MLMLLALALRLYHLDAQSLWYDEGWSIELAHETPARALVRLREFADPHPPGYYLLLIAWANLFGRSVWALRALSALLGALTVGAIYGTGKQLFDRATGLLAAAVLAFSSAHWVYSQEMRMYTLLTLCLALLLELFHRYGFRREGWSWRHWIALVGLEALAVYTHFFAVFALAALAVWLALQLTWEARRGDVRPLLLWLASQVAAVLAYLPWLSVTLERAATHSTLAQGAPGLCSFLLSSWSFLVGGHIALQGREQSFAVLAAVAAAALVLATIIIIIRDRRRMAVLYLLVQFLLPQLGVYALMLMRPGYHPRYVFMVVLPLALLLARSWVTIARLPRVVWAAGLLLAVSWFGATGLAAQALLTDRYYDRDDARATAAFLKERLSQGSVVLMSHSEWALRYYLRDSGLTDVYPAVDVDTAGSIQLIETALQGRSQAALVHWGQADVDRRGLIPYLLERGGTLLQEHHLPGYTVYLYALDEERPLLDSRRVDVHFGPLRLRDAVVQTWVPADEATTVAIIWRLEGVLRHAYKVALSLMDDAGRTIARRDQFLRDANGRDTASWYEDQEVTNYYALYLPPGIAPLDYTLEVSVYHEGDLAGLDLLDLAGAPAGKSYRLAEIELTPALRRAPRQAVDRARLGLQELAERPEAAPGLVLNAYHLERDHYRTGERMVVLLEWQQADSVALPDYWPELRLLRNGEVLAARDAAPVYDRYPTSWWEPGETVLDWRDLVVPPELASGPVQVQLQVRGQAPISLGKVEIEAVTRVYDLPIMQRRVRSSLGQVAALEGYDLSTLDVVAGRELTLTLYWGALGPSEQDLAVFTHLLTEDGRLIAQHDAVPAGGARPTTGWVEGEYITDRHALQWVDTMYAGPAMIEVGLYDSRTGLRLLTPWGDSRLLLPDAIMVR